MASGGRIRRIIDRTPDTPEAVAYRRRYAAALTQLHAELAERYPVMTADNVREILQWQSARINELMEVR